MRSYFKHRKPEDLHIVASISIACHNLEISIVHRKSPYPFSLPVFTSMYPPVKHAYTSYLIIILGKGSASLKTLTGTKSHD